MLDNASSGLAPQRATARLVRLGEDGPASATSSDQDGSREVVGEVLPVKDASRIGWVGQGIEKFTIAGFETRDAPGAAA